MVARTPGYDIGINVYGLSWHGMALRLRLRLKALNFEVEEHISLAKDLILLCEVIQLLKSELA